MYIGLGIYMLLGFLIGLIIDGKEMKKEVPYGELPFGVPLPLLRFCCVLFSLFVAPTFMAWFFLKPIWVYMNIFYIRIRFWRAIRDRRISIKVSKGEPWTKN